MVFVTGVVLILDFTLFVANDALVVEITDCLSLVAVVVTRIINIRLVFVTHNVFNKLSQFHNYISPQCHHL